MEIMQDNSQRSLLNCREPAFCCVEVSSACILKCKMCSIWKNRKKSLGTPTLAQWRNFIGGLAGLSKKSIVINFSGAEPLSDAKNLALIEFCARKGLFTSMCTNGVLIDKKMAYEIAQSGLKAIVLSLDGDKNIHDFLRGVDGCFDKAIRAINYLSDYGDNLEIGIQPIILGCNLNEIVKLTKWANEDKRIKFIHFQAVAQPFDDDFDNEWYRKSEYSLFWPQDTKRVHDTIDKLIEFKEIGYKISNTVSQLEVFKGYFKEPNSFIRKNKCNVDFFMNIDQFGNVYMCRLKEPIGNIKEGSAEDMWYSEKASRLREEIKSCKVNCHVLVNCCYEKE